MTSDTEECATMTPVSTAANNIKEIGVTVTPQLWPSHLYNASLSCKCPARSWRRCNRYYSSCTEIRNNKSTSTPANYWIYMCMVTINYKGFCKDIIIINGLRQPVTIDCGLLYKQMYCFTTPTHTHRQPTLHIASCVIQKSQCCNALGAWK